MLSSFLAKSAGRYEATGCQSVQSMSLQLPKTATDLHLELPNTPLMNVTSGASQRSTGEQLLHACLVLLLRANTFLGRV